MSETLNRSTIKMTASPSIKAFACIGGKKEKQGPKADCFDQLDEDPYFGQKTFEQGESELQKRTVELAIAKAGLKPEDISFMFGGDLLNQCIGTTFGLRDFNIPFLGIYGACSTMAEGLLLASIMADNGIGGNLVAVTSSHFCTAERQYRLPLNYGGQRPPTAQWTATASGSVVVSAKDKPPYVRACTIGAVADMGVSDANNMGAAMAPAAHSTIARFFHDTGMSPQDFDAVVTGDLGKVGSRVLCELLQKDGYDIRNRHNDCGLMLYSFDEEDVHAGGSGCGCAASMLCGYFLPRLQNGTLKNILFTATGALLSPISSQQGETIPSIAHLIWLSSSAD